MKRMALALATLAVVLSGVSPSCSARGDSVILAYSPFESTALMWIAEDQRFFAGNGLDVSLRKYDTGGASLDAVLKGEADVTLGVSEFPVVGRAFRDEKMCILGNASKAEFIYLVGRRDRGIVKLSDLKGKRVGTTFGSISEFYLGRLLQLNGLKMSDIVLVDLKTPPEWVNAVAEGDIDAVVTAQPYANAARERLGANAVSWPAQSGQLLYGLIVSTDVWVAEHPELASRLLRSLAQAEDYAIRNPAESKAIVGEGLDLDAAYMDMVWSQSQFGLSLDLSLILAMEDEARWLIATGLAPQKQVPDFLAYICEDPLKAMKPEAVNIIR